MREIRRCSVCVVGGAGFLGSHLVDHLLDDRQCSVLVVDDLSAGRREFVHREAVFHHHDITGSEDHLRGLFLKHKVRFTFNLAASPYVPTSYKRPLRVNDINYFGAMKVINAAQEADCEAILQVSSAEIYGDAGTKVYEKPLGQPGEVVEHCKISEDGEVRPHSSYGTSKAAADYFCQVSWRERQTPVIALRQFNCVGERDELHPYVCPEIYRQLIRQKPPSGVVRLGNNSSRDFLYAGDAVAMAVELLEKGEFGGVYNSGSESSIKIYDLAKLMGKVMGFSEVKVLTDKGKVRPWEIWALLADCSKLYSAIDYRPKVSLEEALRRMVGYFNEHTKKWVW